jgi:tellurite resistance protein
VPAARQTQLALTGRPIAPQTLDPRMSCSPVPGAVGPEGRWQRFDEAVRQLRQSRNITQIQLAAQLGITQGNVSRLEARSEIYLSTLRSYIEALGGHLEIAAVFGEERVAVAVAVGPSEHESVE